MDAAPAPPVGDEAKHEESIFKFIHGLGLRGKEATLACDLVEARDRKLYAAGLAAGREQGAREEREACLAIAATGERLGSGMTLMKSQQQIADAIAARGKAGT